MDAQTLIVLTAHIKEMSDRQLIFAMGYIGWGITSIALFYTIKRVAHWSKKYTNLVEDTWNRRPK